MVCVCFQKYSMHIQQHFFFSFLSFFFFLLFKAAHLAYGSLQARDQIGALAATCTTAHLHHSHKNVGFLTH